MPNTLILVYGFDILLTDEYQQENQPISLEPKIDLDHHGPKSNMEFVYAEPFIDQVSHRFEQSTSLYLLTTNQYGMNDDEMKMKCTSQKSWLFCNSIFRTG